MNDEYISRQAVLKAFKLTAKNRNKDYQRGLQDAIDCLVPEVIADIPSADVQPVKHGRWKSSANTIESGTVKCGNCRSEMYIDDLLAVSASNDNLPNYCPNCGARMDGGDKDDS